jgi:ABC-type lipoprotein export system ATPase subunit
VRLTAERVTFRYPRTQHPVLDDLSCDLPAGSTTAIVGPSGSGKTTLLSLLGGLLEPQAGRFACIDADGRRFSPHAVSTWVLQTVSLLPGRSVEDNVRLGAHLDGVDARTARDRAHVSLTDMGLAHRARDRAGLLSGGEAQRVAVARALASTRPVLFADEPTGQLDARTTDLVLDAMLQSARRTLVLVTHDERAAGRCDRVLLLRDGRLSDRPGADRG